VHVRLNTHRRERLRRRTLIDESAEIEECSHGVRYVGG
jgi:hypothetical protein